MVTTAFLLSINGNTLRNPSLFQRPHRSATFLKWEFSRDVNGSSVACRTKSRAFRILANPNVCINPSFSCICRYSLFQYNQGYL
uniref:Uncharacterized protein n=1 Tax=Rhizophora mucronata TaxID=61149 RepID=A0A2P2JWY7_RHIMU